MVTNIKTEIDVCLGKVGMPVGKLVFVRNGPRMFTQFAYFQDWLDDGVPYRADIRFDLSQKEAEAFSSELKAWCAKPECAFVWKGD